MQPFAFAPHGTTAVALDANVQAVTLAGGTKQVWIDNRGTTDVLVEFLDNPTDADSFRIAAGCAQPLTLPSTTGAWDGKIRLKRPASSSAETVYVTAGSGV